MDLVGAVSAKLQMDIVSLVPVELWQMIFGYLGPDDLATAACVCKVWNGIANTSELWQALKLQKCFPRLKVIDGAVWEKHMDLKKFKLDVSDEKVLDKRSIMPILKQFFALSIEDDVGFTLLTIPNGLSFDKLVEIAKVPKEGNPVVFRYIESSVKKFLGKKMTTESKVVLISNALLDESRNLSLATQKKFLQRIGCEMVDFLTMVTLPVMSRIISKNDPPTCLFNDDQKSTYGRSTALIGGMFDVIVVGGFTSDGLCILYDFMNAVDEDYGVVAMRNL